MKYVSWSGRRIFFFLVSNHPTELSKCEQYTKLQLHIIVYQQEWHQYCDCFVLVYQLQCQMANWFKANQLILNYNKAHYLKFNTKNSRDYEVKPNYQGKCIKSSSSTKFLGLTIDDSLTWKAHIDQMMSKLNTTCFVI